MPARVRPVLYVGRAEDFAVRQELHARIAGIADEARVGEPLVARVAVEKLYAHAPLASVAQVVVGADPRDIVPVGAEDTRPVAEGDEDQEEVEVVLAPNMQGHKCIGVVGSVTKV